MYDQFQQIIFDFIFLTFFISISSYSKLENLRPGDPQLLRFTHLLLEQKNKYFYENEHYQQSHTILEYVNCFSSIGLEYQSIFPIKIKTKPCIVLLKRREDFVVPGNLLESVQNHEKDENQGIDSENNLNRDSIAKVTENGENEEKIIDNVQKPEINAANLDEIDELFETNDIKVNGNERSNEKQRKVETKLKKPSKHTKLKLKKLIVDYYEAKDVTDATEPDATNSRKSTKSSIKRLIKEEKIKELVEKVSQLDLNTVCDLETLSIKSCLLKILEKYVID